MALVPAQGSASDSFDLQGHLARLEEELSGLKQDLVSFVAQHGQFVTEAIKDALDNMFDITRQVKSLDKRLIYEVEESTTASIISRLFGRGDALQRRISSKAEALAEDVAGIEDGFQNCISGIQEGIDELLKRKGLLEEFSSENVGSLIQEANEWKNQADQLHQPKSKALEESSKEYAKLLKRKKRLDASMNTAIRSCAKARTHLKSWRYAYATSLVIGVGLGVLGASTAAVTWPFVLGALTTSAVCYAGSKKEESNVQSLSESVNVTRGKRKRVESACIDQHNVLTPLEKEDRELRHIQKTLRIWIQDAQEMSAEAHNTIHSIRKTNRALTRLNNNLKEIVDNLDECNYAKNRKEITKKLNAAVSCLKTLKVKREIAMDDAKLKQIISNLSGEDLISNGVESLLPNLSSGD